MRLKKPFTIVGIWTMIGLIYSSQSFFYSLSIGRTFDIQRSLFHSFTFCIEWALLTPLVINLAQYFRLDDKKFLRNIGVHFFLSVVIALIQHTTYTLFIDVVENGFVLSKPLEKFLPTIIGFFEFGVMMYWSIVFIYHAIGYYRRYQQEEKHSIELKSQLAEAQLQTLTMQLQPHFLFNTLNTISVLVKKEPSLAQKMIVRLSDLLRLTLERGNENVISLEKELQFMNTYLAIEKVRFGDRLHITTDIAESALNSKVPTFILQPLVENSIRHGIAQRSGNGWITVSAKLLNGNILIEVNDGGGKPGRLKKNSGGSGVGLENTRSRLQQLYGSNFELHSAENFENGFAVRIRIPNT